MSTETKTMEAPKNALKPQLRSSVRKALVQQMARRLDEEKAEETSVKTIMELTKQDKPVKKLMEALYETSSVNKLSNRAAGKLVAEVGDSRRQKREVIPVRKNGGATQ